MALRKVLITVVGHVDHGKTTLLDRIRSTTVAEREAGLITQAIGASIIPQETIQRIAGGLLDKLKIKLILPGILAIDTPGHAAFSHLRKRGGALADVALVVVDINEGFMPQTEEAIEILKAAKTPFIIVANKIDIIPNWQLHPELPLLQSVEAQPHATKELFERRLYELVTLLYEKFGMNADRFDRLDDFTKQIAIVPISAKKGEGLPELLMVIVGLAQKYLGENLKIDVTGSAKGTVLEVKEEKGLGSTLDVIIYDGMLKVGDTIVIAGIKGPVVTKVKALFEPSALAEMRESKTKFNSVKEVTAACGVKISARDIQDVVGGMPIESCNNPKEMEAVKARVQQSVEEVFIETEGDGIVAKADSLGSLEALLTLLRSKDIPIRKASIGDISKNDLTDAEAMFAKNPLLGAVLGFNVKCPESLARGNAGVLTNGIIYKLLEEFDKWQDEMKKRVESKELETVVRPFKIELLRGYVFRQSNPAIVGCEVLGGTLRTNVDIMDKTGKKITTVKGIQRDRESIDSAVKGEQVAVSLPDVILGRQINEGDILISQISEADFRVLKQYKEYLTSEEKAILKEIAGIMRKVNIVWGV